MRGSIAPGGISLSTSPLNSSRVSLLTTTGPGSRRTFVLYRSISQSDEGLPIVDKKITAGETLHTGDAGHQGSSVYGWTDGYLRAHDVIETENDHERMILPVMPLKRVKVPTDTVQLNIFEPRYRLMFRLVRRSKSRMFGVCLKTNTMDMANVGAVCELTHYIPVPEKKTLFISARVIGRFKMNDVVHWKPFVAAQVNRLYDRDDAYSVREVEENIWNDMMLVRNVVSSLTDTGLSEDAFSLEVRRYSLDPVTRGSVKTLAGSHPGMIDASRRAGLMGSFVQHDSTFQGDINNAGGAVEFICSEAKASQEKRSPAWRREQFSFALARTLDFDEKELQNMLCMETTEERLTYCHEKLQQTMKYVIARKSLKDL